jgi:hypothetical protein
MRNIKVGVAVLPMAALAAFLLTAGASLERGALETGSDAGPVDGGTPSVCAPVVPSCRAMAAPGPVKARFGTGERINYLVTLKEVPVGKASLYVEAVKRIDGTRTIFTRARGKTNSFFSKVHKVNVFVEEETVLPRLLPVRFVEDLTDMERRRKTVQTFSRRDDTAESAFDYFGRRPPDGFRTRAGASVHDFISALYNVRTLPLNDGDGICVDVLYFKQVWRISGTVKGRERIQTQAGFYSTVALEGEAVLMTDPSKRRPVKLWLTDDAFRLPVKAASVVNMGQAEIYATFVRKAGSDRGVGVEPVGQSDSWEEEESEK